MDPTQIIAVPDFDIAVNKVLFRIAALPENWDGEGAHSVDPRIIAKAVDFVSKLPDHLKSHTPIPAVVPMRKGNLQFEWHNGPKTLELEIIDPGTIHYLKWHVDAGIEEEDICSISDTDAAVALIEWFIGE